MAYKLGDPTLKVNTIQELTSGNGVIFSHPVTMITDLSVTEGGTGASTLSGILKGNGTSAITGSAILNDIGVPTSSFSMNSQKITSLLNPTSAQDAATKAYVDSVASGLNAKQSCQLATTANITLSGEQTIDGVLTSSSRVLVKNQTTGSQNGIYISASGSWTRATDADVDAEVTSGMYTFITSGTTQLNTGWVLTTANPITLGSTALTFAQFSAASDIIAGNGLTKTGTTLDVVGTANRISVAADSIDISSSYVGQATITTLGTITTGVWTGTTIALANGGTGATTAATARTNLGAVNIGGDTMTGALSISASGNSLIVDTDTFVVDATNNKIGIGTIIPGTITGLTSGALEIANTGGTNSDIVMRVAAGYGTIYFAHSNGTLASPTVATGNDVLGTLDFRGYDGANYKASSFVCSQIPSGAGLSSTSMPSDIFLQVSLRKQVMSQGSLYGIMVSSKKNVGMWVTSPSSILGNLHVVQPSLNLPGTVATSATITLTGTETQFTNDFKPGDTINVSGETVRTVLSIASDTSLTVTAAFSNTASGLTYNTTGKTPIIVRGNGQIGIGTNTPTAMLHLPAGTANAENAPLKFTSGTNLTTPEAGSVEWNGTNLFITQTLGPTRKTLAFTDSNVTGTAANVTGTVALANGGTGQVTKTPAFNALSPLTTQGDVMYHNGTDSVRLAKGTGLQMFRMNSGATAPEWYTGANRNLVELGSDVASIASTAFQNITGMSFSVTSGVKYRFYALIVYTASVATIGLRLSLTSPATTLLAYNTSSILATIGSATNEWTNGQNTTDAGTVSTSSPTTGGNIAIIEGFIQSSAGGTLQLRFAPETATASGIIIKAGSTLEWW